MVMTDKIRLETTWELRDKAERLQRENGSLARAYAACERLLRDRTKQLNQADAENERLRIAEQRRTEEVQTAMAEVVRLRAEIEELTSILNSHRVTYPDRLGHWACEPNRTDDEGLLGYGPPA